MGERDWKIEENVVMDELIELKEDMKRTFMSTIQALSANLQSTQLSDDEVDRSCRAYDRETLCCTPLPLPALAALLSSLS